MPISAPYSKATAANIKQKAPTKSGVYELKSFGQLVYIGHASNLQRRLLEHNSSKDPNGFRFQTAGFFQSAKKLEDKHLTRYIDKHGEMPPWNKADTRTRV